MMQFLSRIPLADLLAGGMTTFLGAFFLWGSSLIERQEGSIGGPHVVPGAASFFLLAMGIGILGGAFLQDRKRGISDRMTPFVFLIVGGGIAYVWVINAVGYFPATLAFSPLAFAAFGGRGLTRTLLPGAIAAVVIYIIFFKILGIYDPPGRFFDFNKMIGI